MSSKITCRAVIEVMGKPKEHVEAALTEYIGNLKKDDRFTVQREEYAEIKKQESEMWTKFVELELESKDAQQLISFCFEYMPSVIEILEPEKIELTETDLSEFFNDLQAKLHQVDMVAKQVKVENENLSFNMNKLLNNYLVVLLGKENLTLEQISRFTGVPETKVGDFLDKLIDQGVISLKNDKYFLNQQKLEKKEVENGEQEES